MPELYSTLGRSTLAADYTVADPTIQVTDPASFPTDPTFHIRFVDDGVGGAVYTVTAVASDVFSITLEFGTDANAATGVSVVEVVTAAMLDGLRADISGVGPAGSLPSTTGQFPGNTYTSEDGLYRWVFDGSVWVSCFAGASYLNPGGSGDRTGGIVVTATVAITGDIETLIGGIKGNIGYYSGSSNSGAYIRFDFGSLCIVVEAKHRQQNSATHGDFKWQGSNDASSWTDIGSSFTLGGSATQTITELSANVTAYRYYQLLGVSGSTSSSPYIYGMLFKLVRLPS